MAKFSDREVSMALLGRSGVKSYPFPGLDGVMCGIRLLSEDQLDTVRTEAVAFCKTKQVDVMWDPDFLNRAIQRFTLLYAVLDPSDNERFFNAQADVARLDPHIVQTLYELYQTHAQAFDPLTYVSAEEVAALVAQLGKLPNPEAGLSLFDRRTLVSFLLTMAALHKTSQTPK
jgi:hypothetical protein